jgi:hypothetical protein
VRVEVYDDCGRPLSIDRLLNRFPSARDSRPVLELRLLRAPIGSPDAVALAVADHLHGGRFGPDMRARADSLARSIRERPGDAAPPTAAGTAGALHDSLGVIELYSVRCPVLCAPEVRSYLDALGVDALADLIGRPPVEIAR